MVLGPALSRGFDVVSDYDNGDIGRLRRLHCFGNPLVVFSRITQPDVVFVPTRLLARRNLAAFRITHFYPISNLVFDTVKNADLPRWATTIFAKLNVSGVWSNNGDRANLISIKR